MPHRAAHDPAQHIAAPVVRRHHPVRHQERGRPQVIRDHPVVRFARPVGIAAAGFCAGLDQGAHRVRVVIVVRPLQQRRDPLQPHARIDRLHVERAHRAVLELLVLHENDVPDLDEPIPILIRAARRAAPDVVSVIIENLGARPARSGWPHLPKVVGRVDPDDPVVRHANLAPDLMSLVIGVINRCQQTVLVDSKVLGDQLPGKGDRLGLEVIAKREIAEHLEERVVTCGVTHVVEIVVLAARPHAFLRRGCAAVVSCLKTCEQVLELHHARVHEHQRRIVPRHQRAGRDNRVALPLEIAQKGRADIVHRRHGRTLISRVPSVLRQPRAKENSQNETRRPCRTAPLRILCALRPGREGAGCRHQRLLMPRGCRHPRSFRPRACQNRARVPRGSCLRSRARCGCFP